MLVGCLAFSRLDFACYFVSFGQCLLALLLQLVAESLNYEFMTTKNCNIMCWNVRGLNDGAKRAAVCNQIISTEATVVCLQETKISSWTHNLLVETVGSDMASNAVYLPSVGASGGILIAASDRLNSNSSE